LCEDLQAANDDRQFVRPDRGRRMVAKILDTVEGAKSRASQFFDKLWCYHPV